MSASEATPFWSQQTLTLGPFRRGYHLITDQLVSALPEISKVDTGLLHLFILHTSASLMINENADPDVATDLETHFDQLAPDGAAHYRHTAEGPDDMAAHIKSALQGSSLQIPVSRGRLMLGTWQGIFLCEHRNHATSRKIVCTLNGVCSGLD